MFNITTTIRRDAPASMHDIQVAQARLRALGYYHDTQNPYPNQALFQAIQAFQSDQGLSADGVIKPNGETVEALNKRGQYIWRTKGDGKVRSQHAARDGKTYSWNNPPQGGHPSETPNCRCWAEPVDQKHCEEISKKVTGVEYKIRQLTEKFHTSLLMVEENREKANRLLQQAQISLGARLVTYLMTLPVRAATNIVQLIQRDFDSQISEQLLQGATVFMQERRRIYNIKVQREKDASIYFGELEKASQLLKIISNKYNDCRGGDE